MNESEQQIDLLGDPEPVPPPMHAPLPWRVWQMSDDEYYLARTFEEARNASATDWGYATEDQEFLDMIADAHELSDLQLDSHRYVDHDHPSDRIVTFRQELERRIAGGIQAPELFAMSDN